MFNYIIHILCYNMVTSNLQILNYMSIRNLKKAMKNSSGFLTLGVHNHGYYAINEDDRIIFHRKCLEIENTTFSTLISYREINCLVVE